MLTDLPAVLPRLQRNYETNLSPSALRGPLFAAVAIVFLTTEHATML